MLFDTLLKKNRAEAEEQAWTKNAPADYESRNKADMDALTGNVGSGFDWDTASKAYQQYRDRVTGEAQDAAANAQANAAALAGGYGSSYADSVAKQGQQQALAGIDNAVPQLRSQALTEYQNQQNGLLEALSGMANTEALDQSAYGSNLANYNNRLNFLQNQSAQARSENDNYWNNLWNGITQAGGVLLNAYDGYKGYTQQKQQATAQALNYAVNLKAQGADDAAYAVLDAYGIDRNVLDNYTGQAPVTRDQQASILSTAASLVAAGNQEAADNLLKMYGMDAGSAGSYDTMTQRAYDEYVNKQTFAKALSGSGRSSGRSSGSSGGSGSSGSKSTFTNSQLRQMASDYSKMKGTEELYDFYKQTLTDAGWIKPDTSGSQNTGTAGDSTYTVSGMMSPGAKLALSGSAAKYGGKQTVSVASKNGDAKITQNRNSSALLAAKAQKSKGGSDEEIYNGLKSMGYSDDEIYYALNKLG